MSEANARAARKIWASRSKKQRAAIGKKISRKRKGLKLTDEHKLKISRGLLLSYSGVSDKKKLARVKPAIEAARSEKTKKKRAESCRKWRELNPGVPGSSGLTAEQAVKLFFASHPDASDKQCAEAIGRSTRVVRLYRDPATRKPHKRQLLAELIRQTGQGAMLKQMLRAHPRLAKDSQKVDVFLSLAAANKTFSEIARRIGTRRNKIDYWATCALVDVGFYESGDWKQTNRKTSTS